VLAPFLRGACLAQCHPGARDASESTRRSARRGGTVTSERGKPPGPGLKPLFEKMGAFHEEMARAGMLLDDTGLRPSRLGWRQRYHLDRRREVVEGTSIETKALIAGQTLLQVRSLEEARAWAARFPKLFHGQVCEIEVRQLYVEADFALAGDMALPA
jgi:hypothetical protein